MTTTAKTMGRPNLISRDEIVNAAISLSPKKVTMTAVANRLGVSVSALYRHVRDRNDLMRLTSEAHLKGQLTIVDRGQSWSVMAREYARIVYRAYAGKPALLMEYILGAFPPASELPSMERFVSSMATRGFNAVDALALARDVRAVALGAATHHNAMAAVEREEGLDQAVDDALPLFDDDALPAMRACLPAYKAAIRDPGWEVTLDLLLGAIATRRGEDIAALEAPLDHGE